VAGDIHTDFDYASLHERIESIACDPGIHCAHWVLVDNPPWHPRGDDMGLVDGRIVRGAPRLTYASIGVYHPSLFVEIAPGAVQKLFPWAYRFADEGRVTGEHYRGPWDNVGTAGQLEALNKRISR
jgi:MurNAc alpha-1-phosphate uridylyltransferase